MMSRRGKIIFWTVITAILLLGFGRIVAPPTRPSAAQSTPLVISEFSTSNGGELTDEDGDYSDWIELTNRSSHALNLEGWSLSDDPTQPDKWTFRPLSIGAGERLIVFASGKNVRKVEADKGRIHPHTNFRLDADGGFLGLYGPTSRQYLDASEYRYPSQLPGASFGVLPGKPVGEETMRYFNRPTPGSENDASSAWSGLLGSVDASVPHGIYTQVIEVELSHPDDAAEIRYTTDGSQPQLDSTLYSEPLRLDTTTVLRAAAFKNGMHPSPITTQTYIFVDDVLNQTELPEGFPSTWGTHTIDFAGYTAGSPVQADYEMDPAIVDEQVADSVAEALVALPSMSLVMAMEDFEYLYSNPRERGPEQERPVSVELLDTGETGDGWQVDAGVRIQGGAGRWEFMPKHSFRLFFKQRYGAAKLEEKVFAASPVTDFDTLVLRAGVDRAFPGHPSTPEIPVNHRDATYLRDEWVRSSQIEMSGSGAYGTFVHLYINGVYWGLYNLTERPDASFAAAHLGGEKDEWFSANHGGAVSGQPDRFYVLLELVSAGGLDDPERYATALEFIDPEHFSDYLILNWYAGNRDWPENNWYADVENPAGRVRFFVWDAEGTWDDGARIVLGSDGFEGAPYPNVIKLTFEALIQNAEFRLTFADRLYTNLYHGGALTDDRSAARWMGLSDMVEPAIAAESARWGDVRYDAPVTLDDWRTARDDVLEQMDGNAEKLISLARDAGYYPTIDPPLFSQQGGDFESTLMLTMTTPVNSAAARIYYTLDGTDPREAISGDPFGLEYAAPIELSTATLVKARALLDGEWSALNQAYFQHPGQQSDLRITEIMYHPVGEDEAEFLELTNLGELPVDLDGAYLEGVDFRFPDGAQLAAGERAVLIRDLKKFRRRYPDAEVYGIYGGKLSDSGERVSVLARNGSTIFSVRYDDSDGWPLSADGAGDSIVLNETAHNAQDPAAWRASRSIYGSPGDSDVQR